VSQPKLGSLLRLPGACLHAWREKHEPDSLLLRFVSLPTLFCLWMSCISRIGAVRTIRTINGMPPATEIATEEPNNSVLSGVTVSYVLRPTDEWVCNEWTSQLSVFRLHCDIVAILSTPSLTIGNPHLSGKPREKSSWCRWDSDVCDSQLPPEEE
jgi:hypothetical protein